MNFYDTTITDLHHQSDFHLTDYTIDCTHSEQCTNSQSTVVVKGKNVSKVTSAVMSSFIKNL